VVGRFSRELGWGGVGEGKSRDVHGVKGNRQLFVRSRNKNSGQTGGNCRVGENFSLPWKISRGARSSGWRKEGGTNTVWPPLHVKKAVPIFPAKVHGCCENGCDEQSKGAPCRQDGSGCKLARVASMRGEK